MIYRLYPKKPTVRPARLLSMLVWMVAGAASYLFVLNRLLIQLRDKRHKSLLIRTGGLLSVGISAVAGLQAARTNWMILPSVSWFWRLSVKHAGWRCAFFIAGRPPLLKRDRAFR